MDLVFLFGTFALNFRILEFHARLTCEHWTARWKGSGFVGLLRVQFALVVRHWQWSTIFDQFQESVKRNGDEIDFHFPFVVYFTLVDCPGTQRRLNGHRMDSVPTICRVQRWHNGWRRNTFQGNLKKNIGKRIVKKQTKRIEFDSYCLSLSTRMWVLNFWGGYVSHISLS
jgi:hypothetical protein